VEGGEVLLSLVGTIGHVAVVPPGFTGNIARAIARIACGESVLPEWLRCWLELDQVQSWLVRKSREVARKTLNLADLAKTPVAVPPLEEQAEIVGRVQHFFRIADALERRVATAAELIEVMTPRLLTKAFRGELVEQNPEDEPATAILERAQARGASDRMPHPVKLTGVRAPRRNAKMTKSRFDEDVRHKPYLSGLLRASNGRMSAEELFRTSGLPLVDFYKQLAWEVENKMIRDDTETLEAM
jgi:type I restriction enzyme, S subunit